jgi:hypothetical protein
MKTTFLVALLLGAGCGGATDPAGARPPIVTVEPIVEPEPEPAPAAAAVAATSQPEQTSVVRFARTTTLYKTPTAGADKVGIVRSGTRAVVTDAADGDGGCASWIQVAPRGWACETGVEPTLEAPTPARDVSLTSEPDPDRPVVPGLYGAVRGKEVVAFGSRADARTGENGRILVGSNSVRATGVVTVDGRRFWRTSGGDLIDSKSIARMSPSRFRGVVLEPAAPLPAWIRSHDNPREPVKTRAQPGRAAITGELPARTVVTIAETSADGRYVRVGDRAWVARVDLRVATLAAPPPGAEHDERWFDIDLDEQVLVAYEGERPVYATLVSTGKRKHRTPTRITRIASKHERATMNNDDGEIYSVADVPWTMYYDSSFALHTSYWHNGFGGPRSHGCINLSPHDARVLYHWSSPDVPPGWIAVYGDEDTPGSLVRVRSRKQPEPGFRGYARRLLEATQPDREAAQPDPGRDG